MISNTTNANLMKEARVSLSEKGKWGIAIGATAIFFAIYISINIIPFVGFIISFILLPQLMVGQAIFYLSISRHQDAKLDQLFETLSDGSRFGTAIGAYFLMILFIVLGFICLIIPGIILAYGFSMTYYILAENKEIGAYNALKESYNMMIGNKFKFFCLSCRFIGWYILSICTFCIGFLWFAPYINTSMAKFYDDMKKDNSNNIKEDSDILRKPEPYKISE